MDTSSHFEESLFFGFQFFFVLDEQEVKNKLAHKKENETPLNIVLLIDFFINLPSYTDYNVNHIYYIINKKLILEKNKKIVIFKQIV